MIDYLIARQVMVERQLVARGISDGRVLQAMREVPRHLFVGASVRHEVYEDTPLPIGEGQTISQPFMVAIMTELLGLKGYERVLEIGTGSGYQASVLSRLCRWVYTVERIKDLSDRAKLVTESIDYTNITFLVGDGTLGFPDEAPYEGIIVTAGSPTIPDCLVEQLAMGGKLVIPVGDRFSQTLKRVIRTGSGSILESHTGCRFVDLVGKHGW